MRPDLAWVVLGAILTSCSGSPTSPKVTGPVAGWHDAGLVLSDADQSAGGVQWLTAVGNRLVANTASGKVFLGQQGSQHWDTLQLPGGDSAYGLTSKDSVVYFGTKTPGHAWQLQFPSRQWTNLGIPSSGSVYVDFLLPWLGGLAAETFDVNTAKVHVYSGGPAWTEITGGWPKTDDATSAMVLNSTLYATTYGSGLWRRSTTDTAWSRVPDPVVPIIQANGQYSPGTLNEPRSLAWYHGNLWVGYLIWSQIVHATGSDTPWVPSHLDTSAFHGHTLPGDVFALYVWNDRLFAAGQNPEVPLVYSETTGLWRYLTQNWGKSNDGTQTTCGVGITLSLTAIGDTLYAAGCGHIFKLPWSQVPQ